MVITKQNAKFELVVRETGLVIGWAFKAADLDYVIMHSVYTPEQLEVRKR